jgi:hypothetical protein
VVKGRQRVTVGITPRFHLNLLLFCLSVCPSLQPPSTADSVLLYPFPLSIIASIAPQTPSQLPRHLISGDGRCQ